MNKFASSSILIGLLLCLPLNDGNCIFIPNEEMDAPIEGTTIRKDKDKSSVSPQARMLSHSIEAKYKKPLWTLASGELFGSKVTLSEEEKDQISKDRISAKKTVKEFLKNYPEIPYEALRIVKHLFNTYTEIQDLSDYLLGDRAVNIKGMYPSDENSSSENRKFFLFPLPRSDDFECYNEWTPTQNIWKWAKDRQKKARVTPQIINLVDIDDLPPLVEGKE
ncbi:MAG: hypothetical protein BGO67_02810 [Alphaproteobacteria bacterium 41-28]|nr:MAG: hypothetical protein BGO67_02810 [Alphaproteobacteria bacterium 41-28]